MTKTKKTKTSTTAALTPFAGGLGPPDAFDPEIDEFLPLSGFDAFLDVPAWAVNVVREVMAEAESMSDVENVVDELILDGVAFRLGDDTYADCGGDKAFQRAIRLLRIARLRERFAPASSGEVDS